MAAFVSVFIVSATALAEPARILALGNSLTAGYGLPAHESFPVRLEEALRKRGIEAQVINGGASGDTSAGGLARLDWALSDNPSHAIVELGANDGLRGIDPANTFANLDAILTRLKQRGIRVLLTGMYAPPNLGTEYGREFNQVYPRLAKRHDVAFYPFFLDGVAARSALNQRDGMHPNADGVAEIVARMTPYVVRLLNRKD